MADPREHLCFALDVPDAVHARHYVNVLSGEVGLFKIGLELFLREGPRLIEDVKGRGARKIFLDIKLFDIPRTVARAREAVERLPIDYVSVHCESLGIREGETGPWIGERNLSMLGVTVLTSLADDDIGRLGYSQNLTLSDIVLLRAERAKEAGCVGVICSGQEAARVRHRFGADFLIITPGIRPQWARIDGDDQRRTFTPYEAIMAGADYVVVGRPIRSAGDPVEAARMIHDEIARAQKHRAMK